MNLALLPMCLLFAVIGTIEDWIVAQFYRAVAEKQAFRCSAISFIHTLLAVFVVGAIIVSESPLLLVCYATGGAVGMYVGTRFGGRNA
jgi:hypothetical protein